MKRYVIFYHLGSEYNKVLIDAKSFLDAIATADAFSRKTGVVIVGVCPELLLNMYCHG